MPSYEYIIQKGGFWSEKWTGKKDPHWFECKKDIMPKIEFYGELEENRAMSNCIVETKMGNVNPDVKECIELVKKFFIKTIHPDAKLIYIVGGYKGENDKPWRKNLKNNLLKRYKSDRTVVGIVKWGKIATLLYPDLKIIHYPIDAANIWPIGNVLAYMHSNMAKNIPNQKLPMTICIGHSLGAHLCGFFGKMLKRLKSPIHLNRIIGLDPAGPIFQNIRQAPALRLEKSDAFHLEVIHTNANSYGFNKPIGHRDIYVNGGSKQPWCPEVSLDSQCSHHYASLLMVNLAEPSNEKTQCTARWKCKSKAYQELETVIEEDIATLKTVGCTQQYQNDVLRIGDLNKIGDINNMKEGVFWVEAGEKSETCTFPIPK